jgi:hypothetical protein
LILQGADTGGSGTPKRKNLNIVYYFYRYRKTGEEIAAEEKNLTLFAISIDTGKWGRK